MFSEGGMLFPDALDKPARTMLTGLIQECQKNSDISVWEMH